MVSLEKVRFPDEGSKSKSLRHDANEKSDRIRIIIKELRICLLNFGKNRKNNVSDRPVLVLNAKTELLFPGFLLSA